LRISSVIFASALLSHAPARELVPLNKTGRQGGGLDKNKNKRKTHIASERKQKKKICPYSL
jgi:hypothetical protein